MSDSFLGKEQEVLAECLKLLAESPELVNPETYGKLTADYGRLLKNFSRIIRISDRNELRLQAVSDELEIEKQKFEGIAGSGCREGARSAWVGRSRPDVPVMVCG